MSDAKNTFRLLGQRWWSPLINGWTRFKALYDSMGLELVLLEALTIFKCQCRNRLLTGRRHLTPHICDHGVQQFCLPSYRKGDWGFYISRREPQTSPRIEPAIMQKRHNVASNDVLNSSEIMQNKQRILRVTSSLLYLTLGDGKADGNVIRSQMLRSIPTVTSL